MFECFWQMGCNSLHPLTVVMTGYAYISHDLSFIILKQTKDLEDKVLFFSLAELWFLEMYKSTAHVVYITSLPKHCLLFYNRLCFYNIRIVLLNFSVTCAVIDDTYLSCQ